MVQRDRSTGKLAFREEVLKTINGSITKEQPARDNGQNQEREGRRKGPPVTEPLVLPLLQAVPLARATKKGETLGRKRRRRVLLRFL